MHEGKKVLCLYAIAFREFVLIKVDSYTCWIKRNIMMMYSRCIIYNGWPGRATIPEVMCLLIHYIRQISGSVWRLFASEFRNAFSRCYVRVIFQLLRVFGSGWLTDIHVEQKLLLIYGFVYYAAVEWGGLALHFLNGAFPNSTFVEFLCCSLWTKCLQNL